MTSLAAFSQRHTNKCEIKLDKEAVTSMQIHRKMIISKIKMKKEPGLFTTSILKEVYLGSHECVLHVEAWMCFTEYAPKLNMLQYVSYVHLSLP